MLLAWHRHVEALLQLPLLVDQVLLEISVQLALVRYKGRLILMREHVIFPSVNVRLPPYQIQLRHRQSEFLLTDEALR